MAQQFYDQQRPELSEFRQACLDNDIDKMNRIAAQNHHWYEDENPKNLPLAELAHVYQAQWYAQIENLGALTQVVKSHLWAVNQPWTAQCWLSVIGYPVDQGAGLSLLVGAPDDRASIVEMAR